MLALKICNRSIWNCSSKPGDQYHNAFLQSDSLAYSEFVLSEGCGAFGVRISSWYGLQRIYFKELIVVKVSMSLFSLRCCTIICC